MTSPTENSRGGARVRFPPPLVFIASLVVGSLIGRRLGLPVPGPRWLSLGAGAVVLLAAVALFASALQLFRVTGQQPRPWLPSPSLIVEGPYRFTRNPIYVAMTLAQIALGLLLDNAWVIGLAPVSLAVIHMIAVRPEEAYLADKFGEPYRRYLASVRRYV